MNRKQLHMTPLLTFLGRAVRKRAVKWGLVVVGGALLAQCLLSLFMWYWEHGRITAIHELPYNERYTMDAYVIAESRSDRAQVRRKLQEVKTAIEAMVDASVPSPKDESYFDDHRDELESRAKSAVNDIISSKAGVDINMGLQVIGPQASSK